MNTAKFTPGPWSILPHAFHGSAHHVRSFHPSLVCKVESDDEAVSGDDIGLANAHLIAAAPELYQALSALTEEADACAPGYETSPGALQDRVNHAFAILAKARGEASQ